MTGAMTLVVAVGVTSAVGYALMARANGKRMRRKRSGDTTDSDVGDSSDGSGTGSAHGVSHSAIDSMGNPVDSGGSDSGGDSGGDGGGSD
jgi:hypothetical protein